MRDALPVTAAVLPLAAAIGASVTTSQVVPAWGGWLVGPMTFASSGLMAALTMLESGAGPTAVLAAVLVVNARLAVYGLDVAHRFRHQPLWFRWLAPHFLVDQTYLLATARGPAGSVAFRRYWLGAGAVMWVGWSATLAASVVLGPGLLELPSLSFAPVAVFIGLLAPSLRQRGGRGPVGLAGAVALLGASLPLGLGLLLGVAAGVTPGAVRRRPAAPGGAAMSNFVPSGEVAR